MKSKVAVVTGASSGIGESTARTLAGEGYRVIMGARRLDRLSAIAADIGANAYYLDVTDIDSVNEFVSRIKDAEVLINNAGGALGAEPIAEADESKWLWMFNSNVMGSLYMTRALLPKLEASGRGSIVFVTSVAASQEYPGGAGYIAAKHAQRAVARTLRLELLGRPVRVIDIAPGMVETDFSLVRFGGDQERAGKVYEGLVPLSADDVADAIRWAVTRPDHVNIDEIVLMPRDQGSARDVYRNGRVERRS
ncbi:MAG: SDR family NAD(P)-dependent oxidoreductase [Acidimicrobiales bacterium]